MKTLLLISLLIQAPTVPVYKITGRILAPDTSAMPPTIMLRSMHEGPGKGMRLPLAPDGKFEFSGVEAGEYDLNVIDEAHPYPQTGYTASGESVVVNTPVGPGVNFTFKDKDVSGIEIKLPTPVRGRVLMSDGSVADVSLRVESTSEAGNLGGARGARRRVEEVYSFGGIFDLPLYVGEQEIHINRIPMEYSVKSVSYGRQDLLKNPLVLSGSPASEILISLDRTR